jgi:hypothetical protein
MRYADSLLTEGEHIVLRSRQHWLALLIRGRAGVFLFILGLIVLGSVIVFNVVPGVTRDVLSAIGMILLVLGVIVFLYRLWHWWAQDYIITNRRLLKVTGVLNKRSADSSLEKINDAILTQPVLGRMLNYGDLEILTAADQANDLYRMLRDPKTFKKVMLTQKHALETEFTYVGGPPPTPPLRAEPAFASPPPAAQPIPPAAAPPLAAPAPEPPLAAEVAQQAAAMPSEVEPDESLEITQTLARLADLRDSGAISAEEYEQKKDDLLSRL